MESSVGLRGVGSALITLFPISIGKGGLRIRNDIYEGHNDAYISLSHGDTEALCLLLSWIRMSQDLVHYSLYP